MSLPMIPMSEVSFHRATACGRPPVAVFLPDNSLESILVASLVAMVLSHCAVFVLRKMM